MPSLNDFESHTLEQQSRAALMDRVDTKFMLPIEKLGAYLDTLKAEYTVLDIAGIRNSRYDSLYFDTHDLSFYKAHHNGKLNRNKVRLRRYIESGIAFLEVKNKTNKSRTIKQRIPYFEDASCTSQHYQFVTSLTGQAFSSLRPTLRVSYHRTTLMHRDKGERVTIDTHLGFYSEVNKREYRLPQLAIVEIKNEGVNAYTAALKSLKKEGIKPIKFSKYCIGLGLTHAEAIKKNSFKPVLSRIKKTSAQSLVYLDTTQPLNKNNIQSASIDFNRTIHYGLGT